MNSNGQTTAVNGSAGTSTAATKDGASKFFMMAGALFGLVIVGGILLEMFVAHRLPPLTDDALAAAKKKWESVGPKSYNFDLDILGGEPGTAQVEVRDGVVVDCKRNGVAPEERRVWDVWTVPGQFETLERELQLAADPIHQMNAPPGTRLVLQCEFDPKYGYPQRYHRIVTGKVPEVFWSTTKFEPK
jgi:hypothetical protein